MALPLGDGSAPRFEDLIWNGMGMVSRGGPAPDLASMVELDGGFDDSPIGFEIGPDGQVLEGEIIPPDIDELPAGGSQDHRANLAQFIDDQALNKIGSDIVEAVERDAEARQPWVDRFRKGLEMMGVVESEMDDGPFPGSSNVTHPLITEACTQFWARANGELVPADGPCKAKVMGEQTEDKIQRAERIKNYLNHELMFIDDQWYSENSRWLFAIPMQGSAFKKVYRDEGLGRNVSIFVPAEDLIAPSNISSLQSAPRYTHRIWRTPNELKKSFVSGYYIDPGVGDPEAEEHDELTVLRLETEDATPVDDAEDSRHEIYEHYCELDLPGFEDPNGIALPYIVTVDRVSRKVLAIYRNWKEQDPSKRALCCFVKGDYVPGMGSFYGLGLFHLIGGLQTAATGTLRAILDAAATASLQGGFVARDANLRDQRLTIEPGIWQGVDATAEELAKAFFTPPFKEPSGALFNVLTFLTQRGEKFTSITELMTGEQGSANAPVGSTIAIIEQAQKVFSTIHKGLHMAMAQELRLRKELIETYMPEGGYPYDDEGQHEGILAEDFQSGVAIIPVSDPNIFSSAQRVAIAQAELQLADTHPNILKPRVAVRRFLEAMKSPNIDELMVDDNPPPPMDPVSEVQSILRGEPVQAYPDQDHLAHVNHYMTFLQNPGFGGNPMVMKQIEGPAMALVGQRLAYLWAANVRKMDAPAPMLLPALTPEDDIPTDQNGQKAKHDPSLPSAPPEVLNQMLQQIAPQLAQAPGIPMPPDPNQAANEAKAQEAQAKIQAEQAKTQMKLQSDQQANQMNMQKAAMEMQMSQQRHQLEMSQKAEMHQFEAEMKRMNMMLEQMAAKLKLDEIVETATVSAEEQRMNMVYDQAAQEIEREGALRDVQVDSVIANEKMKQARMRTKAAAKPKKPAKKKAA